MNDDRSPAPAGPNLNLRDEAGCADAIGQERRRLSRELHDGIAQDLVSIGYLLEDLAADDATTDAQTAAILTMAREHASSTRAELRRILNDLRGDSAGATDASSTAGPGYPGPGNPGPGVVASGALSRRLERFAREVARWHGFILHVDCSEPTGPLDSAIVEELTRIGREAITNAARHSGARTLWLTVRVDAPAVTVVVADDGVGITTTGQRDHETVPGHGVVIMAERAERIGGSVHITDRPGGGTVVTVSTGEEIHDGGAGLRNPG